MKYYRMRHSSPGFTLVEIMVAMVITLIVMGGVYRSLSDEDINYERNEKILDMQNNARVALDRIVRDVRRAGFLGCGGTESQVGVLSNYGTDDTVIGKFTRGVSPWSWTANEAILKKIVGPPAVAGFNYLGEALGFSDNAIAHGVYQEGTDALTLVYLSDERRVQYENPPGPIMNAPTDPIPLTASGFDDGDILYVTDCMNYAIFQKTNGDDTLTVNHEIKAGYLNTTGSVGKTYGVNVAAKVFKLNTATYFISQGDYELCHSNTNRQIASNIEDLQFEFMFDEDGDGDLADEVWQNSMGAHTSKQVQAIRVWVLAMSDPDFSYTDTNNYDYPNSPYVANSPAVLAPFGPPDGAHRHRYLASAVVMVRNGGA